MKFLVIQLSDIHFKSKENSIIEKEDKLFESIRNTTLEFDIIFLIVTGDIAFSGKNEEFEIGAEFILKIKNRLADYSKKRVEIITIPGNHDCNFEADNKSRKNQINAIQKLGDPAFDESVIEQCVTVQEEYFAFRKVIQTKGPEFDNKLLTVYTFEDFGKKIIFNCYNTSYISEIQEQNGKMFYPTSLLPVETQKTKSDLTLSLFHHPFHWLNPTNKREFSTHIHKTSDFYLTGHEHEASKELIDNLDDNIVYHIEGSVLQESGNIFKSEFNLIGFDIEKESFTIEKYYWDKDKYEISTGKNSEWINYKRGKLKLKSKYNLTPHFVSFLMDVGGKFKHPNKSDITLNDIYTYPILNLFNTRNDSDDTISSVLENAESVIQAIRPNSKYLLFGSENIGKTSFLKILFLNLHRKGYVPIFLDGKAIKSANISDFKKNVENAFIAQYGQEILAEFQQEDIQNIFILIDDLDKNPLKRQEAKGKFIKSISNYYRNLILMGNELYTFEEIITDEVTKGDLFSEFIQYEILEFNHSQRYKLIHRWYTLGKEDFISNDEIYKKVDSAMRSINIAMGQKIVPNYPIFLLILLQALETSNPHDLQVSSYGNYYQLLILKTLTESIKDQSELNTYKSYCGELAHFLFENKTTSISSEEFSNFHKNISEYEKMDLPSSMSGEKILDTLKKSGIINSYEDIIEFKYKYTYYFFEAQHLAKYLHKPEIKDLVTRLCQRLHRTEFANILMFLIHFSNDEFIIDELLKNAKEVFNELSVCQLENDVAQLNDLVTELPKLYLKSKSHEEVREEENSQSDKNEIARNNNEIITEEYDVDEDISDIGIASKFNLSFKLIEILGQIIKNNPTGSMTGPMKHKVLKETYELGLRTLNVFFSSINENTDFVLNHLGEIISKIEEDKNKNRSDENKVKLEKERINKIARQLLFSICTQLSFTFIKKVSDSVGTPKLLEKYSMVQNEMNFASVKLINLLIKLEQGSGFPRRDLEKIKSEIQKYPMSYFLLKRMIVNHLHRHPVNFQDKQRICAILGIPMESQVKLDVERRNRNK